MFIKTSKGKIFYKVIGRGRPVLMLHGFPLDHRVMVGTFEPIFRHVRGFKRIYIDLPAMGRSRNASAKNSGDILETVLEFISKKLKGKKLLIVGYSYGGYLAQHLALRKPNIIDGMILVAPVIFSDRKKRDLPKRAPTIGKRGFRPYKNLHEKEQFEKLVVRNPKTWTSIKKYILPGITSGDKARLDQIFNSAYHIPGNHLRLKRKILKPVLILTGRQDTIVGYKDVLKILDNYPFATLNILGPAGHNLQFEQNEIFNELNTLYLKTLLRFH